MKQANSIKKEITIKKFDCFSRQRRSFSDRNFQGALLLEKETLV